MNIGGTVGQQVHRQNKRQHHWDATEESCISWNYTHCSPGFSKLKVGHNQKDLQNSGTVWVSGVVAAITDGAESERRVTEVGDDSDIGGGSAEAVNESLGLEVRPWSTV